MECIYDEALWGQLAEVTTMERVMEDGQGIELGKAVYWCLGLSDRASRRGVRREVKSFAGVWSTAAAVLQGGPLLDLTERSLRHALALRDNPPRASGPGKPGSKARIWVGEFKVRRAKAIAEWVKGAGRRSGGDGGDGK